ncbi:hypothetical protein Tco_0129138 [Tanacetum coccineum]
MRECCFVVQRDAWLRDEFTLSSLEVLLILATFDGLDVGLLEDVIGEDDCDDDDCDEEMSLTDIRTCTKIHQEVLFSERGDGIAGIKRRRRNLSGDDIWILVMAS